MLIYNVTVKVDNEIADDWLRWVLTEHGPEHIATQCFSKFNVLRLLEIDEEDGPTFALQFYAENKTDYERFLQEFLKDLKQKSFEKWGQRTLDFRTVMEVLK